MKEKNAIFFNIAGDEALEIFNTFNFTGEKVWQGIEALINTVQAWLMKHMKDFSSFRENRRKASPLMDL